PPNVPASKPSTQGKHGKPKSKAPKEDHSLDSLAAGTFTLGITLGGAGLAEAGGAAIAIGLGEIGGTAGIAIALGGGGFALVGIGLVGIGGYYAWKKWGF
ncbi:MAG TPA: hypothetical protein VGP44_01545, partial [Gemmatimonadales bacterium]|nr:hypothetical protein [Gemmatimonadales bacterium]